MHALTWVLVAALAFATWVRRRGLLGVWGWRVEELGWCRGYVWKAGCWPMVSFRYEEYPPRLVYQRGEWPWWRVSFYRETRHSEPAIRLVGAHWQVALQWQRGISSPIGYDNFAEVRQ